MAEITPMWEKDEGIIGFKPKFKIKCRHCGIEMIIRFSCIHTKSNLFLDAIKPTNQIAYKCVRCGNVKRYNVYAPLEYMEELLRRRKGREFVVPTFDSWEEMAKEFGEDGTVRRQLESLGYI